MRTRKILTYGTVGLVLCSVVFGLKAWNTLRQPIPQLEFPHQELPEIPGDFQLKLALPLNDDHLLDGEFEIVSRVNEIPKACMETFESSLVTINGRSPKPGEHRWANPGEPFQWSDDISEQLPFRRLEFAGLGVSRCFLHYQMGLQGSAFCLAVIDVANHKMRVGEYHKRAKNLRQLRQMLLQRLFGDGGGC